MIRKYLHNGSIEGNPILDDFKARERDTDYVQSLMKWRIPTENLDAYWDVNGVKLPDLTWFNANIDKRPIVTETPVQVLRDRTLNTTQVKEETQTQTIEQALHGPANANMLSDLDLFYDETFFISRRKPPYGPSNLRIMSGGVFEVRGAELGKEHETIKKNVDSAPVSLRRKGPYTSDPAISGMNHTTSQRPDDILSPNPQPPKKRRIKSPAKTE